MNLSSIIQENSKRLQKIEQENAAIIRLVNENNWGNIFRSATDGSSWFRNVPLNVGRWAANYSLLYVLYRVLNEIKPTNILEFGLGETTKMLQAYKIFHNNISHCITIEDDQNWIDMRLQNGISKDAINLIHAETVLTNVYSKSSKIYKNLISKIAPFDIKFNLILIDGPTGSDEYSRYNILELFEHGLVADDFVIIIDDHQRIGERQTTEHLKNLLLERKILFETNVYSGVKDQAIICSANFKYLITL